MFSRIMWGEVMKLGVLLQFAWLPPSAQALIGVRRMSDFISEWIPGKVKQSNENFFVNQA